MLDRRFPQCLLPLLLLSACLEDPNALDDELDIDSESGEIAGGTVVPSGQLEAVVQVNFLSTCSGTLITDRLVLTAAHCVSCRSDGTGCNSTEWVRFVDVRPVEDPSTRVTRTVFGDVIVHPDRSIGFPTTNDVAVIRLHRPASEVVLVTPIPISQTLPAGGSNVTIAGYGPGTAA